LKRKEGPLTTGLSFHLRTRGNLRFGWGFHEERTANELLLIGRIFIAGARAAQGGKGGRKKQGNKDSNARGGVKNKDTGEGK